MTVRVSRRIQTNCVSAPAWCQHRKKRRALSKKACNRAPCLVPVLLTVTAHAPVQPHRGILSISMDCFYKNLTPEQSVNIAAHNFDHPSAFDFDLIKETLTNLRNGHAVETPIYDFVTSARCAETTRVETTDVILFDGILALYNPEIRDMFDIKIFVVRSEVDQSCV